MACHPEREKVDIGSRDGFSLGTLHTIKPTSSPSTLFLVSLPFLSPSSLRHTLVARSPVSKRPHSLFLFGYQQLTPFLIHPCNTTYQLLPVKMRFTSIIVTGAFAVLAAAQSTTTTSASAASSAQAVIEKCLSGCPATDVNCQAKCISVRSGTHRRRHPDEISRKD